MQAYSPTTESTTLHQSSAKRGLNMGQAYSGPNFLDGGTVASFEHPQITTNLVHTNQNQGQNMMTSVPGQTVRAAREADKAIIDASDLDEKSQTWARLYTANVLEHPNMKSSATRTLGSSPELAMKVANDVGASRKRNRA